ncbi:hypothetical protein SBI_03995 [Streptomyces bingchenggensis BCW-1]|uniref:Uncharacterized protein n=1 Tax=Streptomyces bingchenggensis (strain BCW-1) TaxID=749414 RepID=D7BQ87_STRBB|nr:MULTISPECIES: hypothetical protein [Streptomyces]ADI07116.1 hypothetical protein SBI_03995 [Streptomyces bingchenggensis BCW-1]
MSNAYSPIPELNLLKEFDDKFGAEGYADGFELLDYDDKKKVKGWLGGPEDPSSAEFYDRLIPFAHATGSGSIYALWRCDDRADLADLPVVFLGDEGEVWVHASNLRELLRLLPVERDYAYEDEDLDELFPARQEYLAWLNRNFGLAPPDEDEEEALFKAAMQAFAPQFATWLGRFTGEDAVKDMLRIPL